MKRKALDPAAAAAGKTNAYSGSVFPIVGAAVAAGSVDFVRPLPEIARELVRIARHSYVSGASGSVAQLPEQELLKIFSLLHSSHEVDFTHYKPTTVERRIRRRMALQKVETLTEYLALLRQKPEGLGSSETIGNYADHFGKVDRKHKIYQRRSRAGWASNSSRSAHRRGVMALVDIDQIRKGKPPKASR